MQSFAAIHACVITQVYLCYNTNARKGLEPLYFLATFCLATPTPQVLMGKHLGCGSSCP